MPLKITMFSDFICPFCYIGFEVIRRLKPEFDLEVEWRGFQIHPDWPAEGLPIDKLRTPTDMAARQAAWRRIIALAEAENLPIKAPSVFTNSRAALLGCEYAREKGRAEEYEARVFRAYFFDGENIGDEKVLARCAGDAGLDAAEFSAALGSPRYDLRLKNNALAANQRQVSGVPTFFIGEFAMVGAQNSDTTRMILKRVRERMPEAQ
ncbi:MAG TPA: DsbA family oxidoreductase [Candidatus Binataceae bacterium]|nr:DsbA family oxidoreductase [Candidatus Binataceae bacterium]